MADQEVTGQRDEKPDIITLAKDREETGMATTNRWVGMWQRSLRYFLSDQLHGRVKHKKWDWVILNYIWPSIMQEMAKLSRNFKHVVSPTEPSDTEIAEAFQGFLGWQWKKGLHPNGMRVEQLKAILDGKLCGYRVSKIYWEQKVKWVQERRRWEGEVRHRLWPPSQFWASDNEYINDGDCGTVRYLELPYAQSLWPDFKKKLFDESVTYENALSGAAGGDTVRGRTQANAAYSLTSATGGIDSGVNAGQVNELLELVLSHAMTNGLPTNDDTKSDRKRYCRISEQYLKDYTEDHKEESIPVDPDVLLQSGSIQKGVNGEYLKPDGSPIAADDWPNQESEWDEPRYPNNSGRYIIRNKDTLLNPKPEDQIYPHSVWPFVVTPHYLLPHMWQGSDAISLYRHTQDHINVTASHLVNNMKQFGDPRIAIEQDALAPMPVRTEKKYAIMRGAGAIIRLARGGLSRFKVLAPAPLSPGHMMMYQLFTQEYKNIQGLHDIAQGKKTSGRTTAREASFLAISANDRIKLQNIFEEEWALQVINLVAEMDQFYYETGRIVRIIGEDQILGATEITEQAKTAKFDIDIEPSEGQPFDEEKRIEKYKMANELLAQPAPNPILPEFLRVLGISAWQKLLVRHSGWQEFVAFEQILKAVEEGQLDPKDGLQMIIQRYTQRLAQSAAANPNSGDNQNGTQNGNSSGQS